MGFAQRWYTRVARNGIDQIITAISIPFGDIRAERYW
jgi:hypothetical protein